MLTSVLQDEDLLKQLVVCYFDPATKDNAGVRQALSYFLPVYCHSRKVNMEKMAAVATAIMHVLINMEQELDEEDEMVEIAVVGNMLVDWTDARKLVVQDEAAVSWDEAGRKEVKAVNGDIHLDLAADLLEKTMSHGCTSELPCCLILTYFIANDLLGEEKKALLSMVGKLYITSNSNPEKLQTVHELVLEAIDLKIATDAPTRNALSKMEAALVKVIGELDLCSQNKGDPIAPLSHGDMTAVDEELSELPVVALGGVEGSKLEMTESEGKETVEGTHDSLLEELLTDEDEDA